jgi:hypothetical protein
LTDVCYLYWIHRPSDTNLLEEGYIGISINPDSRWKHHLYTKESKKKNHRLYNAMRKYDDYRMTILLIGSSEYCLDLEKSLRPKVNIGLNHSVGGKHDSNTTREHFTDSIKMKISLGLKKKYAEDETYREKFKTLNRGRVASEVTKGKQRLAKLNKGLAWENSRANLTLWEKADVYFNSFEQMLTMCANSRHKISIKVFCELTGLTPGNSQSLIKMFRSGWNPSLDNNWKTKFNKEN